MKTIADTMVFYYLGTGNISLEDVVGRDDQLFCSPVSVYEIINKASENFDASQRACRAILDSKAVLLSEPESFLVTIFGQTPICMNEFGYEWMVQAMAHAISYDRNTNIITFESEDGQRQLPIELLNLWNQKHEQDWMRNTLNFIRVHVPMFDDWYTNIQRSPQKPGMPEQIKKEFLEYMNSQLCEFDILSTLYERVAKSEVGGNMPMFPSVKNRSIVRASKPLACYVSVYRQYLIELASQGRLPELNDRWDTEFLVYLADSSYIFATAENRWATLFKVAGFGKHIRHIKVSMMTDDKHANRYDFRAIEKKWQQRWEAAQLFRVENTSDRPKFYGLDFFPYPSGAGISVGHCRNYVPLDVACRQKVMQGYNVLHPMGWDAFGQPAENEAIKRGRNPKEMVEEYAANYKRQLKLVGISYDWSREINSSHPDYYKWTQWIFLLLYKRGLAYRASTPINWCPSCKTGLANEEVVAGRCWRCGTPVEKRPMPQWYFQITAYADRLLSGLDTIQWPEGIKLMQREWIGRSEGAEVDFPVVGHEETIRVFTTRPDTLWGATFMVLAPEHPLVDTLTMPEHRAEVEAYKVKAQRETEIERQSTERAKTGVFTGSYAINPVNGEPIPIWIADYVLMGYGTGAIMAVPAHDQRDFEFARKFGIPIVLVYRASDDQTEAAMTEATPHEGVMILSPFAGSPNDKETVNKVIRWLEEKGIGKGRVNYRLRDWLISRQRYWGAPIPIVHCPKDGEVPVPENQLPVLLPDVEKYEPTGTGESPLAGIPAFVNTTCPKCGGPARRETDTMGGFACSSWYFLRFADPHNDNEAFRREAVDYWLPVDLYVGGAEHAVMHLLYARFWTKVLFDAGLIGFEEPFQRLRNQGALLAYTPGREVKRVVEGPPGSQAAKVIKDDGTEIEVVEEPTNQVTAVPDDIEGDELIEDWKILKPEEKLTIPEDQWIWRWVRMSKSKGNVVTPDEVAEKYGADSLRVYGLFVAPFEDTVHWTDTGIEAAYRYVNRVWRLWTELRPHYRSDWHDNAAVLSSLEGKERDLRRKLHQTIRKVGEDIESFRFNTCIAALMEFTNDLSAFRNDLGNRSPSPTETVLLSEILETLPLLFAPIAPHLADELWERLGKEGFTFKQPWPQFDPEAAAEDAITIVIQVNGKVRDRLLVPLETPKDEVERLALASEKVKAEMDGKQVRKVISVPGKLVNVVIG